MLAVGKELLIGRTLNTNALWIGKRMAAMGGMLAEVTTIDDDLGEIGDALKGCLGRAPDFLIVVGGLGPTYDDMTLRGIAKATGRRLKVDPVALDMVKRRYARRGLASVELTPARKKMATLPSGAKPVRNSLGTAPGVMLRLGGTLVFCLPGVPSEMRGIFRESVEPRIAEKTGALHREYVTLGLEGIYESALAPLIEEQLKTHPGAYIKSHPRGVREGRSRIELDVAVVDADAGRAKLAAGEIVDGISAAVREAGADVGPGRTAARKRR